MKTAEEVRGQIFKCLQGICSCVNHASEEDIVLKALTAYADERVKESASKRFDEHHAYCLKEARAEALEEAAKVAANYPMTYMTYEDREERLHDLKMRISKAIHALKEGRP